ncbi:hypothetical protein Micbo1qcDRAFT_214038 [Microdochium bolleyi]|uniref:Zn(2)-C6 fungal-type domain-containing protein n=1 Tax=Microdochium bolleyi TaxID=196109 RepID=A0A136IV06_9PEZI|nr:hypothetical protein Micbo1qcDRAFT_214038 [Microdochium bolleyi]
MPSSTSKGSAAASRKRQVPCQECRLSHVKCDKLEPRCRRCAQLGLDCHVPLRVRLTPNDYNDAQRWIKVPETLSFVDESTEIASEYILLEDGSPKQQPQSPQLTSYPLRTMPSPALGLAHIKNDQGLPQPQDHAESSSDGSPPEASDVNPPPMDFDVLDNDMFDELVNFDSPKGVNATLQQEVTSVLSESDMMVVSKSPGLFNLSLKNEDLGIHMPTNLDFFSMPIIPPPAKAATSLHGMTGIEAYLFRHYTHTLAACLDGGDPMKRFELIVPERALTCTAMLKAIFAIAARHLCETTHHDPVLATRYHQESIRQLVPMMNRVTDTGSEENIFATSIILRMLEEMSGDDSNDDYLRGIHRTLKVRDLRKARDSLGAASYWVGVRQEIYSAVMSQSPVKADLEQADRGFEPADDFTWSMRAVVLLADTLNFCFGGGGGAGGPVGTGYSAWVERSWSELYERCVRWEEMRPASFEPYFAKDDFVEGEAAMSEVAGPFPERWFYSSCHIIGIQNHTLSKLFLLRFDPKIPRVGPRRKAMQEVSDRQIMHFVRQLCGVGTCNHWAGPAMHAASMGIAMFGDLFTEKHTQEAMLDILRKTELIYGRPTRKTQYQLMTAWGWTEL